MSDQPPPHGVHLNGSIPLANAEEVFRVTSSILGERLHRIPDGETGVRTNWIGWQRAVLARNPSLELIPPDPNTYASLPRFKLRPGVSAGDVVFDQLGYADAALASYAVFSQLKQAGVIPTQYRLQVSLPTPLAPVAAFMVEEEQAIVQPAYEKAMFAELDKSRQVFHTMNWRSSGMWPSSLDCWKAWHSRATHMSKQVLLNSLCS